MQGGTLSALLAARAAHRPAVLVTELPDGGQRLIFPDAPGETRHALGEALWSRCLQAQRDDRSGPVEQEGRAYFVQVFNPPLRLAVVGAVHITQALAPMAELAGYEVTVIDPRRAFASDLRFPGIRVDTDWPDEAMERLAPDHRTAVVTLTHDPKLDDPALQVALGSPAFYIGSLGSRKTHQARLGRLRAAGFAGTELERIHGPVGLDIGAKSPAEIALAIMGQVIQTLRVRR